jgi:very-short-patch-repair endonuclease
MRTDERIAHAVAGQHGVATRVQLLAAGVSRPTLDRWVRSGRLVPLHRGVYRLATYAPSVWTQAMAAVLAAGARECTISHAAAARLWKYPGWEQTDTVYLICPRRLRLPGVYSHRFILAGDEVTRLRGVPVTTPARTVLDLAGIATMRELEHALAAAERTDARVRAGRILVHGDATLPAGRAGVHGNATLPAERALVNGDAQAGAAVTAVRDAQVGAAVATMRGGDGIQAEVRALLERYPCHPGSGRLRRLLAALDASGSPPLFLRSRAEERALTIIRRGRIPEPHANVQIAGFEVDFVWPNQRVILEVDGYAFHSSDSAFDRDRERDRTLAARGYQVLRFSWRQLSREPCACLAALCIALGQRMT